MVPDTPTQHSCESASAPNNQGNRPKQETQSNQVDWSNLMSVFALIISIAAFYCSWKQTEIAQSDSELSRLAANEEAERTARKIGIYEVLAGRGADVPKSYKIEDLKHLFKKHVESSNPSLTTTDDDFHQAFFELLESKVVIGLGDMTYTLLQEDHFVPPADPALLSRLDTLADPDAFGKMMSKLPKSNSGTSDTPDRSAAVLELSGLTLRTIDKTPDGMKLDEVYLELKNKGFVSEARFSADLLFLGMIIGMVEEGILEVDDSLTCRTLSHPGISKQDPNDIWSGAFDTEAIGERLNEIIERRKAAE